MVDSRTKKEEYMANLKSALSGVSPQNSLEGGTSDDNEDYYEQLKNESYKTMLSKEVQAYNAEEQARKYTNAGLYANGYGTQGISESASLGIANSYSKAMKDAQNEYDQSLVNISKAQYEGANSDFESFATLLGNSSSTSQLSKVLEDYGYMDENGEWTNEFNKLDKKTQSQIKSLYSLYYSEFENQEWLQNNTINGIGYKDSGTAIQNIATADGVLGSVSNELRKIFGDEYLKTVERKIKDGGEYVVKLVNGSDDNRYVYMIYRNGTWYQTTANVYNKADYKDLIKGAK